MSRTNLNRYASLIVGLLILIGAFVSGFVGTATDQYDYNGFFDEFYANASTELFSIGITVLVIDGLNRLRARDEEKRRLILQMGSDNNTLAKEAVRILRLEGWLTDGSLNNAELRDANLQDAVLRQANLQGVRRCSVDQLRPARTLRGAILPDGTQLPDDDSWQAAFDTWCEAVKVDQYGYIITTGVADDADPA